MTIEQIKNWLNRPKEIENKILSKKRLREFLRDKYNSTSVVNQESNTNTSTSSVENVVIYIDKINNEIKKLEDEYVKIVVEIERIIEKLSIREYGQLLHLRYLENKSWKEIADIMTYSENYVNYKLNNDALKNLVNLLN